MRGSADSESFVAIMHISIHASTWEAAHGRCNCRCCNTISIHASTWEAATGTQKESIWNSFQFTPLHERQHQLLYRYRVLDYISIHASTWEAADVAAAAANYQEFQFTPLHERQQYFSLPFTVTIHFNSRLYMRGSFKSPFLWKWIFHFNSRLYMRGSNTFPCHSP